MPSAGAGICHLVVLVLFISQAFSDLHPLAAQCSYQKPRPSQSGSVWGRGSGQRTILGSELPSGDYWPSPGTVASLWCQGFLFGSHQGDTAVASLSRAECFHQLSAKSKGQEAQLPGCGGDGRDSSSQIVEQNVPVLGHQALLSLDVWSQDLHAVTLSQGMTKVSVIGADSNHLTGTSALEKAGEVPHPLLPPPSR